MKSKSPLFHLCFLGTASLLAAIIICLSFSPRFALWRGLDLDAPEAHIQPEVNRAADTLRQLGTPFAPIENPSNRPIQWRLLFPLAWHFLCLPKKLFLALPHIGCLLALGMIAHVAYGAMRDRFLSMAVTVILGASSWFFVSTGWLAYFDSWLLLGLLVVVFSRPRTALLSACLLCPWIDERFIIALPFCIMLRFIHFNSIEEKDTRAMYLDAASALSMVLFYAAVRIGVSLCREDYSAWYLSGQLDPRQISSVPIHRYLEGIWAGIRGGIFFIPVFLWFACARISWIWRSALLFLFFSTLTVGLLIACDLSRSMAVFVPAALSGIVLAYRKRPRLLRFAIPAVLAVSLISPAKHVITAFTIDINSLRTEIAWYRNPPDFLRPEFYLFQAIPFVKKKEFAEAKRLLDNAIILDSTFAPAHLWTASILAQQGNPAGAIAEIDKAISINPGLPDAFHLRGTIHQARNELEDARADFIHALQISEADWPQRSECSDQISRLNARIDGGKR